MSEPPHEPPADPSSSKPDEAPDLQQTWTQAWSRHQQAGDAPQPGWPSAPWPPSQYPWPQSAWPQHQYPPYPPTQSEPRRRRAGRTAAIVAFAVVSWLIVTVGLPAGLGLYVLHQQSGQAWQTGPDEGLSSVPADISASSFRPTASDKAYFRAIGFNGRRDTCVTKWTLPVVHVWMSSGARAEDRRTLTKVLAMVNKADRGRPRFVASDTHVEITITYPRHAVFVKDQRWGDRAAGVCKFDYSLPSYQMSFAAIEIDGAMPSWSPERRATLYHEFGHAIGLADTQAARWRDVIMFHETGGGDQLHARGPGRHPHALRSAGPLGRESCGRDGGLEGQMKIAGIHFLVTYRCTYACDHCFVWGSPEQEATMTLAQLEGVIDQAVAAGCDTVYFEGGEPMLVYPVVLAAARHARSCGPRRRHRQQLLLGRVAWPTPWSGSRRSPRSAWPTSRCRRMPTSPSRSKTRRTCATPSWPRSASASPPPCSRSARRRSWPTSA